MEKKLLNLIAVLLAAGVGTWYIERDKPPPRVAFPSPSLPLRAGRWTGRRLPVSDQERRILRADRVEHVEYAERGGGTVRIYIVGAPRDRTSFHPPEYCFIAQTGGSITERENVRISVGNREISAGGFVLSRDHCKTYVLYWYRMGGYYTPRYYAHQIAFLRKLIAGASPGESMLVRLSTEIDKGDQSLARARIRNLIAALSSRNIL